MERKGLTELFSGLKEKIIKECDKAEKNKIYFSGISEEDRKIERRMETLLWPAKFTCKKIKKIIYPVVSCYGRFNERLIEKYM